MPHEERKTLIILTAVLSLALGVVSFFGSFVSGTYAREVPSLAAQGTGQDLVNLFFILPLLVIALLGTLRKSRAAMFVFTGTVLYILYSFVIYCFGVHFNRLFLLYCLTFGASFYLFVTLMIRMSRMNPESWFGEKTPCRIPAFFLLAVAVLFYLLWFRDVVPAVITNTVPKSVSDYRLLVNPVHVMDLAIALPALILTGIQLLKKKPLGFLLTPVMLVFIIELAVALAGMVLMVNRRSISEEGSIAGIFLVLAVISGVILCLFLKNLKHSNGRPA
ncbi:MAG TPA: hypothetical protein ENN03_11765 [bacterium]|nr:hypothetical protein [bacterium]